MNVVWRGRRGRAMLATVSARLVIVEDHAGYRRILAQLLGRTEGFEVVDTFASARAALAAAARTSRPWDIVLMDLEMPEMDGIAGTRALKERWPETRVIVLTVFENPDTIVDAVRAGADGYLLKRTRAPELVRALRAALQGGAPLTPDVARSVLDQVRASSGDPARPPTRHDLTEREQEVLRELVQGHSYQQVADRLGVSLGTVRTHVRAVYRKLQVHSVGEAIQRALRDRLV